jgi:hypothetical protein
VAGNGLPATGDPAAPGSTPSTTPEATATTAPVPDPAAGPEATPSTDRERPTTTAAGRDDRNDVDAEQASVRLDDQGGGPPWVPLVVVLAVAATAGAWFLRRRHTLRATPTHPEQGEPS